MFELRQTRQYTQLQLSQDGMAMGMSEFTVRYGENVAETIARACNDSDNLTAAEAVIMDSVFRFQVWWIGRQKQREERDLGGSIDWKLAGARRIAYVAGFPHGKAWLKAFVSRDTEIQKFMEVAITGVEPKPCAETFEVFGVEY